MLFSYGTQLGIIVQSSATTRIPEDEALHATLELMQGQHGRLFLVHFDRTHLVIATLPQIARFTTGKCLLEVLHARAHVCQLVEESLLAR